MNEKNCKEQWVTLKEVGQMEDNVIIVVNRTQINARLVAECRKKQVSDEKVAIMQQAILAIMEEEKRKKRVVFGTNMIAKDVKTIFGKRCNLPDNAFMCLSKT